VAPSLPHTCAELLVVALAFGHVIRQTSLLHKLYGKHLSSSHETFVASVVDVVLVVVVGFAVDVVVLVSGVVVTTVVEVVVVVVLVVVATVVFSATVVLVVGVVIGDVPLLEVVELSAQAHKLTRAKMKRALYDCISTLVGI